MDSKVIGSGVLAAGASVEGCVIERVVGAPSKYGINYLAYDSAEGLVVLREFLPLGVAQRIDGQVLPRGEQGEGVFRWALRTFIGDMEALIRIRHPNVVAVRRCFESAGTAYAVIEYIEGEALTARLQGGGFDAAELGHLIEPLMDGLRVAHANGLVHYDIEPGNVMLRRDGGPVLVDFGAARNVVRLRHGALGTSAASGYAPIEEYSVTGRRGPWTDVYGLGAIAYRAMTGQRPPSSAERQAGSVLLSCETTASEAFPLALRQAVDWALALEPAQRPQTVEQWQAAWRGEAAIPDFELQPAPQSSARAASPVVPEPVVPPPIAPPTIVPSRRPRRPWLLPVVVLALMSVLAMGWTLRPSSREYKRGADAVVVAAEPAVPKVQSSDAAPESSTSPPRALVAPKARLVLQGSALDRIATQALDEVQQQREAEQQALIDQQREAEESARREAQARARQAEIEEEAERLRKARENALAPERQRQAQIQEQAQEAATSPEPVAVREAEAQRQAEIANRERQEREAALAARQARIAREKAQCAVHITDVFNNADFLYEDLAAMDDVQTLPNGRLRTPPIDTDDGRKAIVEIDRGGCARVRPAR
ncbi:serine/threonine-protein kinase [Algiphilus sp. W345]|uniref:Serine/threonine-protein kinase n=1 Tax=Banduia mediterranea TaxID=3075609 RepID=A0ABU2WIL5_9GAMM|nr:serine/threonine-protein kinase [Algiphilus sp. W345]MDT0497474.1 serine/threonine-protein kinase [Algiphilus sp. W345]